MNEQLSFTTISGESVTVRRRGKHYVQPRGYFYKPGTGPAGETCGGCAHIVGGRRYKKCALNRARWTHGRATDILASAPACRHWERPCK